MPTRPSRSTIDACTDRRAARANRGRLGFVLVVQPYTERYSPWRAPRATDARPGMTRTTRPTRSRANLALRSAVASVSFGACSLVSSNAGAPCRSAAEGTFARSGSSHPEKATRITKIATEATAKGFQWLLLRFLMRLFNSAARFALAREGQSCADPVDNAGRRPRPSRPAP